MEEIFRGIDFSVASLLRNDNLCVILNRPSGVGESLKINTNLPKSYPFEMAKKQRTITKILVGALTFTLCMKSHSLWAQSLQEADLCEKLQAMVESDQKYRGSNESVSEKYQVTLDSLLIAHKLTKESFESKSNQFQGLIKKEALQLAVKNLEPIMANDSLRDVQIKIDNRNTKELIQLVKKHGWLTSENLGCSSSFKTVLIFRHAQKKYWNQVREVIEKERAANRISEYEYEVIDHHLKSRPPMTKKLSGFQNK
jgi:hypothetical protein